ncbi:Arc family DNA-binding protein [Nitratireductor sp. ac15]
MTSDISQVNFRMPTALKERLEREAKSSGRTLTAEIVYRLQTTLEVDPESLRLVSAPSDTALIAAIKRDMHRLLERLEERERAKKGQDLDTADGRDGN